MKRVRGYPKHITNPTLSYCEGLFVSAYKYNINEDRYFSALRAVRDWDIGAKDRVVKVLYPGSYIHIFPSLVFPIAVYVDIFKGKNNHVLKFFSDENRSDVIENLLKDSCYHNSTAGDESIIRFYNEDFTHPKALQEEEHESFDLLMCLSASGFIPESCFHFVRPGGLLFVNDDFGDACLAKAMSSQWTLIGAFVPVVNEEDDTEDAIAAMSEEKEEKKEKNCLQASSTVIPTQYRLLTDTQELLARQFFCSSKRPYKELTKEQLLRNKGKSFSSRPFKVKNRALAFLFRKCGGN